MSRGAGVGVGSAMMFPLLDYGSDGPSGGWVNAVGWIVESSRVTISCKTSVEARRIIQLASDDGR